MTVDQLSRCSVIYEITRWQRQVQVQVQVRDLMFCLLLSLYLSLALFVGTLGPITGQKVKPIEGDPGQFARCTVQNWLVNQIGCCRNTFHNCQAFQHPLSNCKSSGWAPLQWRDSRNRCSRSARFTTQSQAQAQLRVSHSLGPHIHSTHSLIPLVYSFILFVQRAVQGEAFNSNT